jgi:hypothetical protein
MAQDRRTLHALAALLPAGVLGLSIGLAAADAAAARPSTDDALAEKANPVALRLEAIRESMSVVVRLPANDGQDVEQSADIQLAWWGNGGWRNGGWRNGGFRNW